MKNLIITRLLLPLVTIAALLGCESSGSGVEIDPVEEEIARMTKILQMHSWKLVRMEPHHEHMIAPQLAHHFGDGGRGKVIGLADKNATIADFRWRFEEEGRAIWMYPMHLETTIRYIEEITDSLIVLRSERRNLPPGSYSTVRRLYFEPSTWKPY